MDIQDKNKVKDLYFKIVLSEIQSYGVNELIISFCCGANLRQAWVNVMKVKNKCVLQQRVSRFSFKAWFYFSALTKTVSL